MEIIISILAGIGTGVHFIIISGNYNFNDSGWYRNRATNVANSPYRININGDNNFYSSNAGIGTGARNISINGNSNFYNPNAGIHTGANFIGINGSINFGAPITILVQIPIT